MDFKNINFLGRNKRSFSYPLSDHYDGKRFFNPHIRIKKSFKSVLRMLKERMVDNTWPLLVQNLAKPILAPELQNDELYTTYINHASHLIQLQNLNILTDPIYSKFAGPFSLLGPKRVRHPGIALSHLPQIDVVLISHNHYDHMDLKTLSRLNKKFKPLFIVPLGNWKYLAKKKIANIIELDWWETTHISPNQSITLVPAQHWSMRKFGDKDRALWGGFWIQSHELKVYFAGDTGYSPHFKLIHERLGPPDLSILPIGCYEPRWFMKDQHMNPEEAVLASMDLNSHFSIATHHQTFRLTVEHIDEPLKELKRSLKKHEIPSDKFLAPETGETVIYKSG